MTTLYLCAAGNPEAVRLALCINSVSHRWDRIVLLDDDPQKQGQSVLGVKIVGGFEELRHHATGDEAVNLVARTTRGRRSAREKILSYGIPIASLVHPSVDTFGTSLGSEVTIYAQSTLSALCSVGDQCVVFGHAIVGHGATLGTGVVIAPGAVINARVKVGDFAYIGSNASILPDLSVGSAATVAANSAAMVDVEPETTVLGVPAEIVGHPKHEAAPRVPSRPVETGPTKDLSALEARIRKAFEDVLGRRDIASNGNFFDNGGTSALLLTLGSRLHQELDVRVSAVDLFQYPSIEKLVQYLGSQLPAASPALSAGPNRADLRHRRLDARKRAQDPLHHGESFRGPVVGEHENDRSWHSA